MKEQEAKLARETQKIDTWIEELLVSTKIDNTTELLNTIDQVVVRLQNDRYSQEQINKIFKRICQTSGGKQSRSNLSPIMELLVDAVGKMDEVDRDKQPNKRWSGKVERKLRKKLFALDWNINLEDEDEADQQNPWNIR